MITRQSSAHGSRAQPRRAPAADRHLHACFNWGAHRHTGTGDAASSPHGNHLGEAAGLEDGRHQQHVRARVDEVA